MRRCAVFTSALAKLSLSELGGKFTGKKRRSKLEVLLYLIGGLIVGYVFAEIIRINC